MEIIRNLLIPGKTDKPILLDVFFKNDNTKKPLVIFCHGFKGFKDWGHFNSVAKRFAGEDLIFLKFNFSHNGTTPDAPDDFTDLEAFGNNNYIIELNDLESVTDWALTDQTLQKNLDPEKVYLLGHSRGGGISILKASEDRRIQKLATWASVADFINRNKKKTIETWEKDGVVYATNARTKQQMPLYYQFYQNLQENKDRLHIAKAVKKLEIPFLIIHGTEDEAVPLSEAQLLRKAADHAQLLVIEGASHTFDIKHPFADGPFPGNAELVIFKTIEFFKS